MKALCWHGAKDIRCDSVPDPKIAAIVRVTSCAICGSDLHLYDGYMPGVKPGDVMGHEFMGEAVEVGRDNTKRKVGDHVVGPFTIICGECEQCWRGHFSVCERTNRGLLDKIPFGALMNKALTVRTGQTHVNRWTDDLLRQIQEKQIDPSFLITHRRTEWRSG